MAPGGRVLILEQVIPPGNDPFPAKLLDLNMLVMTEGGRERTPGEYALLLESAGLNLRRIHPTASAVSVVEAVAGSGATCLQNAIHGGAERMAKKAGWQEFGSLSGAASLARPAAASPATPRAQQQVRVQRTKAGKGGKLVTAITGLELPEAEARSLLKQLKASAGTGGTLKDGVIELQGDQVAPALEALEQAGFRPKQAGG
jgi:translation initiation factor 1